MNDHETDCFAFIIEVRRARDEQLRRNLEAQRAFVEAQERQRPWCLGIVVATFLALALSLYWTS